MIHPLVASFGQNQTWTLSSAEMEPFLESIPFPTGEPTKPTKHLLVDSTEQLDASLPNNLVLKFSFVVHSHCSNLAFRGENVSFRRKLVGRALSMGKHKSILREGRGRGSQQSISVDLIHPKETSQIPWRVPSTSSSGVSAQLRRGRSSVGLWRVPAPTSAWRVAARRWRRSLGRPPAAAAAPGWRASVAGGAKRGTGASNVLRGLGATHEGLKQKQHEVCTTREEQRKRACSTRAYPSMGLRRSTKPASDMILVEDS